jgi:hypothetical protein
MAFSLRGPPRTYLTEPMMTSITRSRERNDMCTNRQKAVITKNPGFLQHLRNRDDVKKESAERVQMACKDRESAKAFATTPQPKRVTTDKCSNTICNASDSNSSSFVKYMGSYCTVYFCKKSCCSSMKTHHEIVCEKVQVMKKKNEKK